METINNFINGELVTSTNNNYLEVYEPATGKVYAKAPESDTEDLNQAIIAAEHAYPIWSGFSINERTNHLINLANEIRNNLDVLAQIESKDNGKPITLASQVDIPRAAQNFEFFAHAITQFASESHDMGAAGLNYTLRQSIGVVACISPWNLPLYLLTWKIAPALATGNTVICKPSEITPMSAHYLGKLCQQINFPKGVLNILHGSGSNIGQQIVDNPQIKAISFTGGTKTGIAIAESCAKQLKKVSLELGGKNPTIIFDDVDLKKIMPEIVRSAFANQGQICLCGSRILVQSSIYNKFKQQFINATKQLSTGDPSQSSTQQGAIVSKPHMEKILHYIDLAKSEEGTVLTGGKSIKVTGRCENGWFIEPTVIEGLNQDCTINQEEVFGPVVTLQPFDNEKESLALANNVPYGLAASVWSSNLGRCHRMANELKCGIVWVNCWMKRDLRTPFGGIKQSGLGREGGVEALRFFTETKNVCLSYNDI